MRGKEGFLFYWFWWCRITPAYAGKREDTVSRPDSPRDHPRLCGEKFLLSFVHSQFCGITPAYAGKSTPATAARIPTGDHPRLCGEKVYDNGAVVNTSGSPPPMRGKAWKKRGLKQRFGITPAYAGKSSRPQKFTELTGDHPRLCGEKSERSATCFFKSGSPPPMRGKGQKDRWEKVPNRITPAYAGKR